MKKIATPVVALVLAGFSAQAAVYTVKAGDNLTKIVSQLGHTIPEVLVMNSEIRDPDCIFRGQEIFYISVTEKDLALKWFQRIYEYRFYVCSMDIHTREIDAFCGRQEAARIEAGRRRVSLRRGSINYFGESPGTIYYFWVLEAASKERDARQNDPPRRYIIGM